MTVAARNPLFEMTLRGEVATARFRGPDLTEADADGLDRAFAGLVQSRPAPVVTLDLSAVTFLGGMAVGRFVVLNREIRATGGRLTLVNLPPHVREVVAICRLGRVLCTGAGAESVRVLAYQKWVEAGRPGGDGTAFWCSAERELTPSA